MTLTRTFTAAVLLLSAAPSFAGWNNSFQTTCWGKSRSSQKAPCDTCAPAPAPARTSTKVEYETYRYTVPVTVMKPETTIEQVPVQVKSYYWDPVTTYTTRSYYDSCSGQCQQVQVPRTSYVRKEECNTVYKAVERIRMVPVQTEREVVETRPVYTSYGPVTRSYGPIGVSSSPKVDEYRSRPGVQQEGGERITPQNLPSTMPPGGVSNPKTLQTPTPSNYPPSNAHTTSNTRDGNGRLAGEVVKNDNTTPMSNAKLVFVNASNLDERQYVSADAFGQFDVKLASGEWFMYVGPGDGKANYHSKLTIKDGQTRSVAVASK